MKILNKSTNVRLVVLLAIIGSFSFGHFLGEQRGEKSHQGTSEVDPEPAERGALTPEELAQEKGIQASITNDQGEFTLVSVIEGDVANERLSKSLHLVALQRQYLSQLVAKFQEVPGDLVHQRELLAGQIHELQAVANQNLAFLRQNYGYRVDRNYLYIPNRVNLVSPESEQVYQFETAEKYEAFQQANIEYTNLQRKLGDVDRLSSIKPKDAEAFERMQYLKADFQDRFNYNPDVEHQLIYESSALYVQSSS